MASLFDFFRDGSWKHVTDDQMLALMDGELSRLHAYRVQRHLESCWNCRARQGRLQGVIHGFVDYSNELIAPLLPPPPSGRDRFLSALDERLAAQPTSGWFHPLSFFRAVYERFMNPVFVTVVVLLGATVILTAVWQRAARPALTSDEFLAKAALSEQVSQRQAGVAYQCVAIRTRRRTVERAIYRDLAHRRTAIQPGPDPALEPVKGRLASAGVDWQTPLSVLGYEHWRDHVQVLKENVKRTAPGEWTLTTETNDSTVRQASLTVRDTDFHPIARQVVFRDSEEIEIAELNYDVLPWSAINTSLFEPQPGVGSIPSTRAALYPLLPTHAQLEGAELQALLALTKVHADAGEDVQVEPGNAVVHIRGVVETDHRKQEIESELSPIPLVKSELQSLEQIQRQRQVAAAGGPLQVEPAEFRDSPLEVFLTAKGIPAEQKVALSRTLTESSLTINREARMLSMLEARHGSGDGLTNENLRLLNELREKHLVSLMQALVSEESALTPYASANDLKRVDTSRDLSGLASTNQRLCSELVEGAKENSRAAPEIFRDLIGVSSQIRSVVNSTQTHFRP